MSINRKGTLVLSCCGAALVVAATGVVLVGMPAKPTDGSPVAEREGPREVAVALTSIPGPAPIEPGPSPIPETPIPGTPSLQDGETFYGMGEGHFRERDYAAASRDLSAEVNLHPDRFYPSYLLGLSLWKEGRLEESIETLSRALSLDPSSVKARVNLGRVQNDAGRFEEALASSEEAIALAPDDSSAHNVRGRALLNLGRRDESIGAFRTAVEKDPDNAHALNNLGYALIGAGQFTEAVPVLEKAVQIDATIGYFHNNLGMAYERTGRMDMAREAYRVAVETGGSSAAERNLERLDALGVGAKGAQESEGTPRLLDESSGLY
jgi:Flp pilus assembly protein TadD